MLDWWPSRKGEFVFPFWCWLLVEGTVVIGVKVLVAFSVILLGMRGSRVEDTLLKLVRDLIYRIPSCCSMFVFASTYYTLAVLSHRENHKHSAVILRFLDTSV